MPRTMTIQAGKDKRSEGRRRALRRLHEERRSLGVSPDGRLDIDAPAPRLPVLRLDAKPLKCQRGCGAPAFLDQGSLIECRAQRARWMCMRGHDGWVQLVGVEYDEGSGRTFVKGKHYHYPDGV